jgi:hypothetical protein
MKKELDYRSAFRHGSQQAHSWSISRGTKSVNTASSVKTSSFGPSCVRCRKGIEGREVRADAALRILARSNRKTPNSREIIGLNRKAARMNDFISDLKHSVRMFLNSPGFTATAVAALALGIAATTAIFSVVNAVLLRPLSIPDPDRLVMLMTRSVNQKGETETTPAASPVKYAHWRAQSSVLEHVSAFSGVLMNYTGGNSAEQLSGLRVSPNPRLAALLTLIASCAHES